MNIYQIATPKNPKDLLKDLGVEGGGVSIMSKKMELLFFQIRDIKTPAANILKQDALSIGAELAVPGGVILCEKESYDAVLIGTLKQMEILSRKELAQPFGLKSLAKSLQRFLKNHENQYRTSIMGVINANSDSFYEQSRFVDSDAVAKIEEMIDDGADIIDIGGVSSRPGSVPISTDEELKRIKPICDAIRENSMSKKALFSIDSYTPEVVEYALESGFGLINDITGANDERIIELAVKYGAKLCIMHMQGTPENMQNNPEYTDVMAEVSDFFRERIDKCEQLGLGRDKIILDIGIGFGKRLEDNLELIRNISHFRQFGCELLVGASRKSMIDTISPSGAHQRLPGTLALHLYAVEHGASIVRCHDVKEHVQALKVWENISNS